MFKEMGSQRFSSQIKLVLASTVLFVILIMTNGMQVLTDYSQFPVIYGDDGVPIIDSKVLAVDMDLSSQILVLGQQISTSGPSVN